MGLEEKISDEEIQYSFQRRRRRTLLAHLTGVAGGALSFFTLENIPAFPNHIFNAVWSAGLGFALYAASTTFSLRNTLFHESKKMSLFLKTFYDKEGLEKHRPSAISFCEYLMQHAKDPLQRRSLDLELDFLRGDSMSALRKCVQLCQAHEKYRYTGNLIERWNRRLKDLLFSHSVLRDSVPVNIEFALAHLGEGDTVLAEKRFRHAAAQPGPLQISTHCLVAYYFDTLAKQNPHLQEEAQRQWQHTLELLLQNPSSAQQFRRLGESRHEVFEISGEGILKDTFIFKRDIPSDHLTREYTLDQFLYTFFGDQELVAQPLASLVHEEKQYLILRRVAGRAFTHTNQSSDDDLLRFMPFLYTFHRQLTTHRNSFPKDILAPRNYAPFLQEKYAQRVPAKQHQLKVIEAIGHLARELDALPRNPIHGDLHPGNIFVRDGGFTLLDPEHMCLATQNLDLASLLEHDQLALSDGVREQALNLYYQNNRDSPTSFEGHYMQYLQSALFRSLHVRGIFEGHSYGSTEQEHRRLKEYYEQRAHENMKHLKHLDKRSAEKLEHLLLV